MVRLCALALLVAASLPAQHRFRVLFGGNDALPSDWSGTVDADSGTVAVVGPYHFGAHESHDRTSWKAGSQWDGNINLLPQEKAVFPKARWKGVVVDFDGPESATVQVRTAQGAAGFRVGAVRYQRPESLLDGRIRVERSPRADLVDESLAAEDHPAMATGPDGRVWVAWIASEAGAETIRARSQAVDGRWGESLDVTPSPGDYHQVELVSTVPNSLLAVWSATVGGALDLYARSYRDGNWGEVEQLTRTAGADIFPCMAAASDGTVFLAWQSPGGSGSDISLLRRAEGRWSQPLKITEHPASDWEPSVAINSRDEVAIAWDSYRHGNYDIFLRRWSRGKLGPLERITASEDFEAHVSLAYDRRDRLWMAFDNGGPGWGGDQHGIDGLLRAESGLYFRRQVQVRVLERGRLVQPARPLDQMLPRGPFLGSRMTLGLDSSYRVFTELPKLQVDGRGRVWAVVRTRAIGRANRPAREGRSILPYWMFMATMFDGEGWTAPVKLTFSDGRIDQRPGLTTGKDGDLWIATAGDGCGYLRADERFNQYDVRVGRIEMALAPAAAVDRELLVGADGLPAPVPVGDDVPPLEAPLWKRYQMEVAGRKFRLAWGDLHRHSDLSFDGQSDGSLYDMYRYAIDAARMDFLGPSEHLMQTNDVTDYIWRTVDKAVDFYKIPGVFYPMLNYERTVGYPDGHRNIVSRARGNPLVRIKPGERENAVDERDMIGLWEALLGGSSRPSAISIPHTTATQMGTDWRYNDEDVERLVEIYQGNRDSYEYYGAPRSAVAEQVLVGGYITSGAVREKGFVWNALAKGYKLGFIASSDHRSTHMSYAAVYTPERSYGAIWDSLYERRTYAATDNIIVDFQCQGHAMGEEFAASRPPRLEVGVIGTDRIKEIAIIKNNEIVYLAYPGVTELSLTYTDQDFEHGEHYYYARIIQDDGNMAWASPIWVEYAE